MSYAPAALLLRSATVVDTRDGSIHHGTDVLVRDGVITAVGQNLATPDGTAEADVRGRFLVPGFNDMHAHPLGRGGDVTATLELMLAHGITGYRQMSGDLGLLRARAEGTLTFPPSSPALLAMPGPLLTMLNTATADEAAATVREQVAAGADFVKSAAMTRERFFDAQTEALRLGVPIVGNLPGGIDVLRASRIGMKSIEHFGSGLGVLACCSTEETTLQQAAGTRQRLSLPKLRLPFMDKAVEAIMKRVVLNPVNLNKPPDVALVDHAVRTYDEGRTRALAERFAADGTWHVPIPHPHRPPSRTARRPLGHRRPGLRLRARHRQPRPPRRAHRRLRRGPRLLPGALRDPRLAPGPARLRRGRRPPRRRPARAHGGLLRRDSEVAPRRPLTWPAPEWT